MGNNGVKSVGVLYFITILSFFLATMLFNHSVLYYFAFGLLTIATVFSLAEKTRITFPAFFALYILFLLYIYFQIHYIGVYNKEDSEFVFGTLSMNIIVYLILYVLICKLDSYVFALRAYVFACFVLVLIILGVSFALGLSSRLGSDLTINLWGIEYEYNANAIAHAACVSLSLIVLNKSLFSKKHLFIFIPLFLLTILLSGSRKASIITIFLFAWKGIAHKSFFSQIKGVLFSLIIISALIYVVIHNPFLYEIIGTRFEGLIDYYFYGGQGDASSSTRDLLAEQGLEIFYNNPWFGVGVNNFRAFNNTLLYTHNDYIELLSGVGIVGLVFAYLPKLYILKRALFEFKDRDRYYIFIVIIFFIAGMGTVSYYKREDWLILIIILAILDIKKRHKIN